MAVVLGSVARDPVVVATASSSPSLFFCRRERMADGAGTMKLSPAAAIKIVDKSA